MSKNTFYISCPFDTYSGYGARSRDLIKAIIELDKYDVKLISQRWGNTPWGFIKNNPEWSFLNNHLHNYPQLTEQPDIWMQITVPNEFQPVGKFNIGCTAGMETTLVDGSWVEGINRMNINLVSSEHSKQSFLNSTYEKKHTNGQSLGQIKVEKPIEVLFEGANIDIYKVLDILPKNELHNSITSLPESFAYLFVGHWMQGDLGQDRKNVGLLIKAFYETFKNKTKKPALILKTSGSGASYMDRNELLKKINQIKKTVVSTNLPNIYLLHGEFTDIEMNQLYNHPKIKAMVSLTKGEGFGRPLLEFSLTKKPIITSGWSGHIDFLNPEFTSLLPGKLENVHDSAAVPNMILKESQWFSVDHGAIGHYLKDVFENYKNYTDRAKRQAFKNKNDFSWEAMKNKVNELFTQHIPDLPKKVELKLPNLKKIELTKKPIING
jgi:glycosyltransferase involved in cell wall biosynthesis